MFIIKSIALLGAVLLLLKTSLGTGFTWTLWLTLLVVFGVTALSTTCSWGWA